MAEDVTGRDLKDVEALNSAYQSIRSELKKVIIGQTDVVEQLLISLLPWHRCWI